MHYIWFTFDGIGLSIANKLKEEKQEVIIAQIENIKELKNGDKEEEPETKRRRLSLYDGILEKVEAKKVLKAMSKIKNKDDYFVIFDFNNLWVFADAVQKMGFNKGLFPTRADYLMEKDREKAKEFVKKYYPALRIKEVKEFSKVEEGIKFLQETDKTYVLKGNDEEARTVVPDVKDPKLAASQLIDVMQGEKEKYEKKGYILEEKIIDPIEFTPEIIYWNGKRVFTDVDIENKPFGSGNTSIQTGSAQSVVYATDIEDKINQIAFPAIIDKLAELHRGMFIWDASILYDGKDYIFGEFCPMREGWDSFFAELAMCESVHDFFESIVAGKNPLKKEYGVAVRGFNLHKDGKERRVLEGVAIKWNKESEKDIWVYEMKKEDDGMVNTGVSWDLVVFTGTGDDLSSASQSSYNALESFSFEGMYFRPMFDLLSKEYPTSIPNRFDKLDELKLC